MNSEKDQPDNSIFGIKIINPDNQNNSNLDIFGNPIDQEFAFQSLGENDNSSPAVIDMVNRLELAVKSNKIDAETINLYQQITNIIKVDRISQLSPILNSSTINLIRDKSLSLDNSNDNIANNRVENLDINQENNNSIQIKNLSKNQNNNQYSIMSFQEIRIMQGKFLESRGDYQKNIENIEQISLNQPNNGIKNPNI